jgi:hypothetical protein
MKPWARLTAALREPLIYVMVVLFAISIALFLYLYSRGVRAGTIEMEIAKVLLQVGVVAVVGALLSLLVSNREQRLEELQQQREQNEADRVRAEDQRREDRRYREELLKATLSRITSSYNNSKRARRDMKALALDRSKEGVEVIVERYDLDMLALNEAQLELETIKSDVETAQYSFPSHAKLTPRLKTMESYLGEIITEYKEVRSANPSAKTIPLSRLGQLSDFLGEVKGSRFKENFSAGHDVVRQAIRNDLQALTSRPAEP